MYVPKNPFFSEFSYGYALTEELASSTEFGLKVLPIFPSQFAEGKLGFDVFIDRPGMPLFLQFKLAHVMTARALEAQQGEFVAPFYRMYLRCFGKVNQHKLLLELEQQRKSEVYEVYYVAPAFHLREELARAYSRGEVWARSLQVKPSEIGELSEGEHHVSFQKPGTWQIHSADRSERFEVVDSREIMRRIGHRYSDGRRMPLREQLGELDARIRHILSEEDVAPRVVGVFYEEMPQSDFALLRRVAYLARSIFDCQLFALMEM